MADENKAPPADASDLSTNFADRLTFPKKDNPAPETPGKFNWADEVTTPIHESDAQPAAPTTTTEQTTTPTTSTSTTATSTANTKPGASSSAGMSSLEMAQKDGASPWQMGSDGLDEPEFDVNVKLADLQEDPNNPLYSVKRFEDLNLRPEILKSLAINNFRKPSKIQERALPLLMKNPPQNLIGQSQSGTGKTAAFTLNMLSRIDYTNTAPQALVLAPTRELARQIAGVAKVLSMFTEGLQITEAVPNPANRGQQLQGQIIVGTPGTTMDMIKRRQLDVRLIKTLTLDEADNMLDMQGLGDQCKRVKQLLPKDVQVVLFSATFPPQVLEFASLFAPNSNQITLEREKLTVKGIKQMYLDCSSDEDKYAALLKFYGLMTIASSIIFVKRRDTAQEISRRMTAEGHSVAQLTGALEGSERDKVFDRFRTGEAKVLITTNVLSRGIDVQTVTMVINYDIPDLPGGQGPDYETYLHRIGRTGRFGRTGAALSFVHDRKSWQMLMDICKHFAVEPTRLDTDDWDNVEKLLKAIMRNARNAPANQ